MTGVTDCFLLLHKLFDKFNIFLATHWRILATHKCVATPGSRITELVSVGNDLQFCSPFFASLLQCLACCCIRRRALKFSRFEASPGPADNPEKVKQKVKRIFSSLKKLGIQIGSGLDLFIDNVNYEQLFLTSCCTQRCVGFLVF